MHALRDLVGATVETESREKFGLSWHGKSAARRLALTPSTGTLRPCPGDDESVDWDTTKNVMIEGDNLEVLKLLQKAYAGRVKLCFIDPPYNTGKDFVYKDNYRDPLGQYEQYTGQRSDEGEALINKENRDTGGRFHTDWLNMIYPRLLLARELLRDDGVIFVTIDDAESDHLGVVMDEIFGRENRVASVAWQHSVQPKGYTEKFSIHHNTVLIYQRSDRFELGALQRTEEHNQNYSNPDNDPKGDWRTGDLRNSMYRPNLIYPVQTPSGKTIEPPEKGWRYSVETMNSKIQSGEIIFNDDETRMIRKIYLKDQEGRTPETIWFGKECGTTREAASQLKTLFDGKAIFDTPKPTRLLRRIFDVGKLTDGDIVIDFFAGSGTTGHAVMEQNASGDSNYRYVLVQLPEPMGRNDFSNIAEFTKERLRRAGKAIAAEASSTLGANDLDTGFRVFKLDTANVKAWEAPTTDTLQPGEINTLLEESVDGVKLDRTDEDLLWGAMLNLGLPLDGAVDTRTIDTPKGQLTVYVAGACTLLACFAKSMDRPSGEALAQGLADLIKEAKVEGDVTVLLRDSAFAGDDAVKVNLVENLRQHAPDPDKVRVLSI